MKFNVYFVHHFLASEVVNITIVQHPSSVEVGKNVTLTCNATAERKITELKWIDTVLKQDLRKTDAGVVDLPQPALGELSVLGVLTLSVKDKNGDKWPKTVKCQVMLESIDNNSNGIVYREIHEVVVTGKLVMGYMLKHFGIIHTYVHVHCVCHLSCVPNVVYM